MKNLRSSSATTAETKKLRRQATQSNNVSALGILFSLRTPRQRVANLGTIDLDFASGQRNTHDSVRLHVFRTSISVRVFTIHAASQKACKKHCVYSCLPWSSQDVTLFELVTFQKHQNHTRHRGETLKLHLARTIRNGAPPSFNVFTLITTAFRKHLHLPSKPSEVLWLSNLGENQTRRVSPSFVLWLLARGQSVSCGNVHEPRNRRFRGFFTPKLEPPGNRTKFCGALYS